jgi:hypothetical protein
MIKIEAMFMKTVKVLRPVSQIMSFAKQIIYSETNQVNIPVPEGFTLVQITEFLPDLTIKDDEKKILKN